MKEGYLSGYFAGVAAKTLTAVEVDASISNQHEFQGVQGLRDILGRERIVFPATFLYFADEDEHSAVTEGSLTWYDAREAKPNRSAEFHLYYTSNEAVQNAKPGDTLIICKTHTDTLIAIIAESSSTFESQLRWMFGFTSGTDSKFTIKDATALNDDRIDYSARFILERLGIEVVEGGDSFLSEMLDRWNGGFPTTKIFSEFARSTMHKQEPRTEPDAALMEWMEWEEVLFRRLEKHLLAVRLKSGFADVDQFIDVSLSVQNRRKSRVGHALENHLDEIFRSLGLQFGRGKDAVTENKKKPDFLFPGKSYYDDPGFDATGLTMLGSKSTCKDRWRQVVTEADRISPKHLLTLEAAISSNQTDEMAAQDIRLVIPASIQCTYNESQRSWLMNLQEFIDLILKKQAKLSSH